jgi:hypothetical protein
MPKPFVMLFLMKEVLSDAEGEGFVSRNLEKVRARCSAEWEAFARGEGYQRYSG